MSIEYENFYNINMPDFYEYVSQVQSDFNFNFHNSLRDLEDKRRVEIWKGINSDSDVGLVWLEISDNGEDIPLIVATDVLRTMNEQGVVKLFFYTNGAISDEIKDIIDGESHYLFSPSEIIEVLIAVEKKHNNSAEDKKRKNVKIPSGFVLIRNYLQAHTISGDKVYIKTEHISKIVNDIVGQLGSILSFLKDIDDIDNISKESEDRIRSLQYGLLPQLIQVSSFVFTNEFMYVRDELFNMIKECVIYMGAVIEMELLETVEKHRLNMLVSMDVLQSVDGKLSDYRDDLINSSTIVASKLMVLSVIIILIFVALAFVFF